MSKINKHCETIATAPSNETEDLVDETPLIERLSREYAHGLISEQVYIMFMEKEYRRVVTRSSFWGNNNDQPR